MKRILVFVMFVICCLGNAQDTALIDNLSGMNFDQAKKFADEIATAGRTKWISLYNKENDIAASFYYVDSALGEKRIELLKSGKELCETGECFKVSFLVKYEGENKNLEIKGTKKYRFNNVTLKYLDIFPIWKKYFKPDAELETLPDSFEMKRYKQGEALFKFNEETAPYWTLEKFY